MLSIHKLSSRYLTGMLMALLLMPLSAFAETLTGKINGLQCAMSGFVCPVDQVDAMVALERDFVLQQADGSYYMLTNVDRSVKARYALKDVSVTGKVNKLYKAVDVDTLQVDGKTVWSKKMQDELEEAMRKQIYTTP
ncbi:hypothetical protein [Aromatoleum anaerobium]|uniref:Uncharacterized protein n=1 Tax=Aromatoleum anaerobium TaxID=182180 RepID=A0ABX1PPU9_9RHOO|nr:hypothetical protein [Aromatoleum anaerobium]MCK0506902.1 hypothetical protein [Aromatoleum anaerobium]